MQRPPALSVPADGRTELRLARPSDMGRLLPGQAYVVTRRCEHPLQCERGDSKTHQTAATPHLVDPAYLAERETHQCVRLGRLSIVNCN
jgi:hypothetical protein